MNTLSLRIKKRNTILYSGPSLKNNNIKIIKLSKLLITETYRLLAIRLLLDMLYIYIKIIYYEFTGDFIIK